LTEIRVFKELCKGIEECGICIYVCPKKLFAPSGRLNPKGYRPPQITEKESCTGCENCMLFCPDLAIAVKKTEKARGARK